MYDQAQFTGSLSACSSRRSTSFFLHFRVQISWAHLLPLPGAQAPLALCFWELLGWGVSAGFAPGPFVVLKAAAAGREAPVEPRGFSEAPSLSRVALCDLCCRLVLLILAFP